jgi:hypothetical protein
MLNASTPAPPRRCFACSDIRGVLLVILVPTSEAPIDNIPVAVELPLCPDCRIQLACRGYHVQLPREALN